MTQFGPVRHFPVQGKIVCITGGGSGIGLALAKECHNRGARVLIGDLKLSQEAAYFCSQTSPKEVAFQKCDVSSWEDLHNLITTSMEQFGDVPDVYSPVAGIYEPPTSNFWDDEEGSYKTIRINVEHPIKFTRLAMRALAGAEKQGVVCLVSSSAGIRATYISSLYAASKHAIVGFAKSMGEADLEEGVRIVCALPGLVTTPLWQERDDNFMEWAKLLDRNAISAAEMATVMLRMIEDGERYEGGTCLLKTAYEEKIVEEGYRKVAENYKQYDPSPRPRADLTRCKTALARERGLRWI